jgi:long-subunit fatty acid transport protein
VPGFKPAFVPEANDEWREALGARYALSDRLELRAAVSYSNRIVGTTGVSPMTFDNDHYEVTGGAAYLINEKWTLDFMAGVVPEEHREVPQDPETMMPGSYETGGFVFVLGLQRRY